MKIKMYQIKHSWRRYGKLFWATTTWGFAGTPAQALSDFTSKRKEVVSCFIMPEDKA